MLAEPPIYVTRMARCKACGTAFASADQSVTGQLSPPGQGHSQVEMCPSGHIEGYSSADYYFL